MKTLNKVQNQSTKGDPVLSAIPLACADEKAAVEFMEAQRWGDQPACPRCGSLGVYRMLKAKSDERQEGFRWRCRDCASVKSKDQFTVRTGTVYEDSRIPLKHWCFAFWRSATSKKGVSALEIHRQTGISYKSALFLLHRIRFAMQETPDVKLTGEIEIDEVYLGGKGRRVQYSRKVPRKPKVAVMGIKERGGKVRPRILPDVTGKSLKSVIRENVDTQAFIYTDEYPGYKWLAGEYAGHATTTHSKHEYARWDASGRNVHSNSIESFFGLVRRGLDGIYHSVSRKHLHRYLSEFEFRHNHGKVNDGERVVTAIKAANHKRLTYAEQIGEE